MTRQTKITLITSGVLVLGLLYYFFVHVDRKEALLHKQNYRILSTIAGNVEQKFTSLRRAAANQKNDQFKEHTFLSVQPDALNRANLDSCGVCIEGWPNKQPLSEDSCYKKAKSATRDRLCVVGYEGEKNLLFVSDPVENSSTAILMRLPLKNLLHGLLREKYFNEYVLLRDGKAVYSTLSPAYQSAALVDSLGKGISRVSIGVLDYVQYEHPVQMGESSEWILVGLKDTKAFNVDQYRVSVFVIIILIILFLVFTAGMPFLKLKLLGKKEQLDTRDILYVSCGVVLGAMLSTLLFLAIYDYSFNTKGRIDKQLAYLGESVSDNFVQELESMYRQLKTIDALYNKTGKLWERKNLLADLSCTGESCYPYFIQVSWMDSTGEQSAFKKWSARDNTTSGIDVSGRYYFTGLKDSSNLRHVGGMAPGEGFVLEQIISWNTGEYLTVMGIKSKGRQPSATTPSPYSAAMSTKLISVTDPVLPTGFSFAIIDQQGNVLYHSESEKSLNENLLEETERNARLQSAMYAEREKFFRLTYQAKPYRAYVRPINGTGYYIVTMADQENFRTSYMVIITSVTLLATLLFSLYGLQFMVKRVITYRKSLLEYKVPQFTWLRPDKSRNSDYGKLFFAHIFHIGILLFTMFVMVKAGHYRFITPLLYLAPTLTVYWSYFRLSPKGYYQNKQEDFGMKVAVGLSLFIVSLGAVNFYHFSILGYLCGYLLVTAYAYHVILFGLESMDAARRSVIRDTRIYKWFCERKRYFLFLLSLNLLLALVPITGFYISVYNQEAVTFGAYSLLDLAKQLDEKERTFDALGMERKGLNQGENKRRFLEASVYPVNEIAVFHPNYRPSELRQMRPSLEWLTAQKPMASNIADLMATVRPFYNDLVVKNNELVHGVSADSSYVFVNKRDYADLIDEGLKDTECALNTCKQPVVCDSIRQYQAVLNDFNSLIYGRQVLAYNLDKPSDTFYLAGHLNTFEPVWRKLKTGQASHAVVFIACILVVLVLLYSIIRYSIQKIFLFQQLQGFPLKANLDHLKNLITYHDVYVVGLPISGRSHMLKELKERLQKRHTAETIDFRKWKQDKAPEDLKRLQSVTYVILEHMEYNWSEGDFNKAKLTFIGDLLAQREPGQRFILCSALHPHYLSESNEATDVNIKRFLNMIKTFVKIFYPISCGELKRLPSQQGPDDEKSQEKAGIRDTLAGVVGAANPIHVFKTLPGNRASYTPAQKLSADIHETIQHETRCGPYLSGLQQPLTGFYEDCPDTLYQTNIYEEIILKVQSMATPYYQSLWNFLTVEEKVVVIDLARDSLVNDRNLQTINVLINKGIIYIDPETGRIHLFNNSFRNFVLTRLTDKEEKSMLKAIKGQATWETFKTPAIIIAVTIVLFLFATQQEKVDQIVAFVSASAASITVVARLLAGVFNKRKDPTEQ